MLPEKQLERRNTDKKILDELNILEDRFHTHLLIYANNGVESKRVADALVLLVEHSALRDVKVDTMYAKFTIDKGVEDRDVVRMNYVILISKVIVALAIIGAAVKIILS